MFCVLIIAAAAAAIVILTPFWYAYKTRAVGRYVRMEGEGNEEYVRDEPV